MFMHFPGDGSTPYAVVNVNNINGFEDTLIITINVALTTRSAGDETISTNRAERGMARLAGQPWL